MLMDGLAHQNNLDYGLSGLLDENMTLLLKTKLSEPNGTQKSRWSVWHDVR
jgi:hypothetical protein